MTLRAGCRLVVAPMFHLPVDWSRRLHLGSLSLSDWRSPDAEELALLLPDASLPTPRASLSDCVCLFRLPRHLLAAWSRLLARLGETGSMPADGFNAFARDVGQFLSFKEMPLPEAASVDLLVSQPGQSAVLDKANGTPLWGGINLGDEATSLVFINLLARDRRAEGDNDTLYPLVRLRIEPGEGYRLPANGLLFDICTVDKHDPDVLLRIYCRRQAEGSGTT
jgi:hypothetical protein